MKVVHVLKKIEMIDQDIKELRKLEKTIRRDKSFATPIFMSIEKQINIMLGERIQLLELKIENPPATMRDEIEGVEPEAKPAPMLRPAKKEKPARAEAGTSRKKKEAKPSRKAEPADEIEIEEIPMLTQDMIDARFKSMSSEKDSKPAEKKSAKEAKENDDNVKLLDIALEKGTLDRKDIEKEKEKKVRFFRDNFPTD